MKNDSDGSPLFDSSSVIDIIALFKHDIKTPPYIWAGRNAIIITSFLIEHPGHPLRVVGGPTKPRVIEEPFGQVLNANFIKQVGMKTDEARNEAQVTIGEWVQRQENCAKLNAILLASKSNKVFQNWLSHEAQFRWRSYSRQINGLWDPGYDGVMALIKGNGYTESKVHSLRVDGLEHLEDFVKWAVEDPLDSRVGLYVDFYILSALLRGEFHNFVADSMGQGVYHHHFRLVALDKSGTPSTVEEMWKPSLLTQFLAAHVIAAASGFREQTQRIGAWIQGLNSVREYLLERPGDMSAVKDVENVYESRAETKAAEITKRLDLPSRWGPYKHNAERFGIVLKTLGLISGVAGVALVPTGSHLLTVIAEAAGAIGLTGPSALRRAVATSEKHHVEQAKALIGTYFDEWSGDRLITPLDR